jgi:hypothetical protein
MIAEPAHFRNPGLTDEMREFFYGAFNLQLQEAALAIKCCCMKADLLLFWSI